MWECVYVRLQKSITRYGAKDWVIFHSNDETTRKLCEKQLNEITQETKTLQSNVLHKKNTFNAHKTEVIPKGTHTAVSQKYQKHIVTFVHII